MSRFQVGDRVRIEAGPFAGQQAVVANAAEPAWVWVQINGGTPIRYRIHEVSYVVQYKELEKAPPAPTVLPADATERKGIPITTGVLDYFPAALAEVAKVSKAGNDQHNPGEPLHWARGKSMDQADTIVRHLMERGEIDTDGMRHSAKAAWRILALLQIELEEAGEAPLSRGSEEA